MKIYNDNNNKYKNALCNNNIFNYINDIKMTDNVNNTINTINTINKINSNNNENKSNTENIPLKTSLLNQEENSI